MGQFEGMFENAGSIKTTRSRVSRNKNKINVRAQALNNLIEEISINHDRYHLWWTGPAQQLPLEHFLHSNWSAQHQLDKNVIMTMAVIQGMDDKSACSTPLHDMQLFLGSLRRVYEDDIIVAIETSTLQQYPAIKNLLIQYRVIVYELSSQLCSKVTRSIYCGSADERVPASVFRYYFYEKWALMYKQNSLMMLVDYRDVLFQSNPFSFHLNDWFPDHQLAVFLEFYPNMVISRCRFNKQIMSECYGNEGLRRYGSKVIVSSGGVIGSRDAVIAWSHHMTLQLQEAPGRQMETRCTSGGIEHAFVNYLIYGNKLRSYYRIKIYSQGDGSFNSLGGLKPDTVAANITGDLTSFWKILNSDGYVLNWSGEVSPVVHQLDHYQDELLSLSKKLLDTPFADKLLPGPEGKVDYQWQALQASRCLWGCK